MIDKVRNEVAKQELDSLWITDEASIHLLIGVNIEAMERFVGLLVVPNRLPLLVVNRLFPVFKKVNFDIEWIDDADDVISVISRLTVGNKIGLDKHMSAKYVIGLQDKNKDCTFTIGSDCVDKWRAIKSSEEISHMIEASQLNDKVMLEVPSFLKIGVSEKEVADQIEKTFLKYGAQGLSFDTIVAFGENGADPHATPSDRTLQPNETIIIDMGCVLNGYCSDMTRTFISGFNEQMKSVYDVVNEANKAAVAAIRPNVTFSQIDAIARNIIKEAGYTLEFNHRLGHGIGREVHEPYDVSASNHAIIETGMCFSIEPGVYLSGIGGVRIENLVYVNQEGYGVLLNYVNQDSPILELK